MTSSDLTDRLEAEITSIEELVELEEGDPSTSRWALNALVLYKRQLASRIGADDSSSDIGKAQDLRRAARDICSQLEQLDPAHRPRYAYLKERQ